MLKANSVISQQIYCLVNQFCLVKLNEIILVLSEQTDQFTLLR